MKNLVFLNELKINSVHFLGATNFNDELKYLSKWAVKMHKKNEMTMPTTVLQAVSASDAKKHFGHLVVRFLESHLDCPPFIYPNNTPFMTRSIKNYAENHSISVEAKVKIVRHVGFEKAMIKNAAPKIIDRRITVSSRPSRPVTLKKVTQVPFGVRGRKRKSANVVFIGLKPNPDGCKFDVAGSASGPSNDPGPSGIVPARRTYARATSTPLPQANSQLTSATISQSVLTAFHLASIDEITFDDSSVSFDTSGFGQLYYSSSE